MEGHRKIFCSVLVVTIILIVMCIFLRSFDGIYEICLALLGSSSVGAFLEFLNFYESKRRLVMQIIADNNIITNYMNDALWIYRITENPTKKLDVLVELYEKTQSNSFILTRECYAPLCSKRKLNNLIEEEVILINDVLNILLNCHRTIISGREGNKYIKVDPKTMPKGKSKEALCDEALVSFIKENVEMLMKKEVEICEITTSLKKYFKLVPTRKVKSHVETMRDLNEKMESKIKNSKTSSQ